MTIPINGPKFEVTDIVHPEFPKLRQIRALRNFGRVKAGDLGGFIERDSNLSHHGLCWVNVGAVVCDHGYVFGDAWLYGSAKVYDHGRVGGYAQVGGRAKVFGYGEVCGQSDVRDDVQVYGYALVVGGTLADSARVFGLGVVEGAAHVLGEGSVSGTCHASHGSRILWDAEVTPMGVTMTDGFVMTLDAVNGKVSAGCRYFTFEEAVAHWTKTRGGTALGDERLRCVEFLRSFMPRTA